MIEAGRPLCPWHPSDRGTKGLFPGEHVVDEEIFPSTEAVARRAADVIAAGAREAVRERGRFILALSGGATPGRMLRLLADADVPWASVHLFQVDERAAAEGHPDRNLTQLRACLLDHLPVPVGSFHPMPVDDPDLESAASAYARALRPVAGHPPILDLVHLGLGPDGHTASLVPGDAALDATADVAATAPYRGRRRLTMTIPLLDRARRILWVVTGAEKRAALERLRRGDGTIPAGRIRRDHALLIADAEAGG
jgi:6-phosphogluconolactonase